MPALENPRHERFAQGLAQGKTADQAYKDAGYAPNRFNASRLKTNEHIIARYKELQAQNYERFVVTKQYITDAIIENAEKALGRITVKIGQNGEEKEVFLYRGDVANAALKLAGTEIGMFVDRKEIKHLTEYDNMSDEELVIELNKEAQRWLEYVPLGEKADGTEDGT